MEGIIGGCWQSMLQRLKKMRVKMKTAPSDLSNQLTGFVSSCPLVSSGLTLADYNKQLPIYCYWQKFRNRSIPDSAPRLSTSNIAALSFKIAVQSRSITVRDQIQAT